MPQTEYLGKTTTEWVAALEDQDPLVRRLAAHALGDIGDEAREAVTALSSKLSDPKRFVRVWAASAMGKIQPGVDDALETLIDATQDKEPFVRSLAAWQLGRLGPGYPDIEQAGAALAALEKDDDPSVRVEATLAIMKLKGRRIQF